MQQAEVAEVEPGFLVADGAVERLHHVKRAEVRGEGHLGGQIEQPVAQRVLRLLFRRPRAAAQRACAAGVGLRARFALNDLHARVVAVDEGAQRADLRERVHLIRVVAVEGERVHGVRDAPVEHRLEVRQVDVREHAADDLGLRVRAVDGVGRFHGKVAVLRRADAVLPAEQAVRLVPDLKPLHAAAIARHQRADVALPCALFPLAGDGRAADRAVIAAGQLVVQVVAVAQVDPRLLSAGDDVVHDVVEPREVVYALRALRALPAGLDAHIVHAQLRHLIVGGSRIKRLAVELFKADAQTRPADFRGAGRLYAADLRKSFHAQTSSNSTPSIIARSRTAPVKLPSVMA